jgi:ABC-type Fe3+/spermidine/putrescine transport system ATPase subunit
MFQDFALFPHKNAAENIVFGLRMQGLDARQQRQRLAEVLELVGLRGFEQRDVAQLSGGERQRVALARSLAPRPRLLLLDEPLGSLDAALRERLYGELRAIIKQIGLTAVYVTHDHREAFAIADRVAVMNRGCIEQVAAPQAIYQQPRSVFVARFLGLTNILPVLGYLNGVVHTPIGDFQLPGAPQAVLLHTDGLELADSNHGDTLAGCVEVRVFIGDVYRLQLNCAGGIRLQMRINARAAYIPKVGDCLNIRVAPEAVISLMASES